MKHYKYIRIILILIPVFILAVLICKDFNLSGYLKVDYDFCRADPFVSKFSPHGRVLDIKKDKIEKETECSQEMVIDPIYFDVRLPQKFDSARLKIWYKKNANTILKIGPAVNLNSWQWQLKDVNYIKSEGDWSIGTIDYNLKNSQMDRNNLRFLISSPGLDVSGQEIIFNKIEIEFIKNPASKNNFIQRLKEWIKFSNLYRIIYIKYY